MVRNNSYETVAASQTAQVLGSAGHVGDVLERLIVTVATAATSTVAVKDGNGSDIPVLAANTPIGAYSINMGGLVAVAATTPGWKVTTGAGATVIAVGRFT